MSRPTSVVVCTYNRAESLAVTLDALLRLDHPDFEVVVVVGPCTDGTDELLERWAGRVKVVRTDERNLSTSRNLGIAAAAGELVVFIDDDAYPEAAWLDHLDVAFDDPEVAVAGGPTFDHTGARLQARYSLANRLGDAWVADAPNPSALLCSPYADTFPYAIGTNAAFRRDVLVGVGGFDEEYEYYLDETDTCVRVLDVGWVVAALDRGAVYHKFLPSDVRTEHKAIRNRYSLVKNRAYFALQHARVSHPLDEILEDVSRFVDRHRDDMRGNIAAGLLTEADLDQYELDARRALDVALGRGIDGPPRTRSAAWFAERAVPFTPFPTLRPDGGVLRVALVCAEQPPGPVNGIGRFVHTLAVGLGRRGHDVHVVTRSRTHDRVDLEDGVWVHRVVAEPVAAPDDVDLPPHVWAWAAAVDAELGRIDAQRPVDLVHLPNWDVEGAAIVRRAEHLTVLGLYTPLRTVMAMDATFAADDPDLQRIAAAEAALYEAVTAYTANGTTIVDEIDRGYDVALDRAAVALVPYGVPDPPAVVVPARTGAARHDVDVLFVGRLEHRKGIDTLLAAIPAVLARHPEARFTIVGDDRLATVRGTTHREEFERSPQGAAVADRVAFLGRVDEDELVARYAACDVFVAPSRYESFGLILVEAMRYGKPVVAGDAGGMRGIVTPGDDGVLVPPGDVDALVEALVGLVADGELRARMGARAAQAFRERFTVDAMVDGVEDVYRRVVSGELSRDDGDDERARRVGIPLAEVARCTGCGGPVATVAEVVTADGLTKTGWLVCDRCDRIVARIRDFRHDFSATGPAPRADGPPQEVPALGEHRVPSAELVDGARGSWSHDGRFLVGLGEPGDAVDHVVRATDVAIRLLHHPHGGVVDLLVDDVVVATVDLYDEGPVVQAHAVVSDRPLGPHRIGLRPHGVRLAGPGGTQVFVEELVVLGPRRAGTHFRAPQPLNRGNPESPAVLRHLADVPADAWVLECGGGDRRGSRPRHVNFEYLPYELADAHGDVHTLPFADGAFDFVFSQAVFEHVRDPFTAARELVRVTRPGGLVVTEVAFLQPLHAVPYHFFNMTLWGVEELFAGCEIVESDWFGGITDTIDWILRAASLEAKAPPGALDEIRRRVAELEPLMDHGDLKAVASGVYVVARVPDR